MNKLIKNLGLSFLLAVTVVAQAQAQSPIGRVRTVDGQAFVNYGGKLQVLRPGTHIYDRAEITTSVGGSLSFNDFNDHIYHLASQGQVQLFGRNVQLVRGYLWIHQTGRHAHGVTVSTANSRLYSSPGQGVISFHPDVGRTQFMTIQGSFRFGNMLYEGLDVNVNTGQFSLIDPEINNGVPRHAASVGQQTFSQVLALFPAIKIDQMSPEFRFMVETPTPTPTPAPAMAHRAPASVSQTTAQSPGVVTYIPLERNGQLKKSRESLIHSYAATRPTASASRAPASVGQSTGKAQPTARVPVRIFGAQTAAKTTVTRAPASVQTAPASTDAFEQGLERAYQTQQRHSDEKNALIRELKNFRMDYQEGH
jgi:hypothetical protein